MTQQQNARPAGITDYLKSWPQYGLPQHSLSNLMFALTRSRVGWWKKAMIHWFIRQYKVNMSEAAQPDPDAYASFNDFFTRALKPDARPLCDTPNALLCPIDGYLSQLGRIANGSIFQAKGRHYSLHELLAANDEQTAVFADGHFATLYLSPSDYHRIHMPVAGTLTAMSYVPGRLFSVSPTTTRAIPRLFARNERVIAYFDTPIGPMALILVGAIFVGSMETVWHGVVTPPHSNAPNHWHYQTSDGGLPDSLSTRGSNNATMIRLEKGEEMGRFNMGSTVILLFPPNTIAWDPLQTGQVLRMGQRFGTIL